MKYYVIAQFPGHEEMDAVYQAVDSMQEAKQLARTLSAGSGRIPHQLSSRFSILPDARNAGFLLPPSPSGIRKRRYAILTFIGEPASEPLYGLLQWDRESGELRVCGEYRELTSVISSASFLINSEDSE